MEVYFCKHLLFQSITFASKNWLGTVLGGLGFRDVLSDQPALEDVLANHFPRIVMVTPSLRELHSVCQLKTFVFYTVPVKNSS